MFEANMPITKCGWSFKLNTFLYGLWLEEYDIGILNQNHSILGVDYEIIGELNNLELEEVINCFKNSSSVKRRFKRLLGE